MKRFFFFLIVCTIVAGCSSVRYTYFFDRYALKNVSALSKNNLEIKEGHPKQISVSTEQVSTTSDRDETLAASASTEHFIPVKRKPILLASEASHNTAPKIDRPDRKTLPKLYRELKKVDKSPNAIEDGKKDANALAVLGIIFSLLGILGLLSFIWVLGVIMLVIGVFFSIAGLKSKRKGLATLGLILGGIPLVALIVLILAFLIGGGYDM